MSSVVQNSKNNAVRGLAASALASALPLATSAAISNSEPSTLESLQFPPILKAHQQNSSLIGLTPFTYQGNFQSIHGANDSPLHTMPLSSARVSKSELLSSLENTRVMVHAVEQVISNLSAAHPQARGSLMQFSTKLWSGRISALERKFMVEERTSIDAELLGIRKIIMDFRNAAEGYEHAFIEFNVISNSIDDIRLRRRDGDATSPQFLLDSLEICKANHRAGNLEYHRQLKEVQNSVALTKQILDQRDAFNEHSTAVAHSLLLAFGLVGSFGASIGILGPSAVQQVVRASARLMFSPKVSFADRKAYLKLVWNSVELTREIRSDESVFRRAGRLIESAALLLRKQQNPGTVARFHHMIRAEPLRSIRELESTLADLLTKPFIQAIIWGNHESVKVKEAQNNFYRLAIPDGPPCQMLGVDNLPTEKARDFTFETIRVMRRSFQMHQGFGALTMETRSRPDGTPALIVRFGYDVTDSSAENSLGRVNAPFRDVFPGPGTVISSPSRQQLFGASVENPEQVMEPYGRQWPWASEAVRDIQDTQFIFARGVVAVSYLKDDPRYSYQNCPLTYVSFNDHFPGTRMQGAFLVPREAVQSIFKNCVVPFSEFTGYTKRYDSVQVSSPREFLDECRRFGVVIDLTTGSNLGGGLCNGFPIDSPPLHLWEGERRYKRTAPTFDAWGRVHKVYISGPPSQSVDSELAKLFAPLAQGHKIGYEIATRCQNLFDVLRLRYADWKRGQIPRRYGSDFGNQATERWSKDPLDEGSIDTNPGRFLMLEEILSWNELGRMNKLDCKLLPILAPGSTLNYLDPPAKIFLIDSADLSFKFNGRTILTGLTDQSPEKVARRHAELRGLWEQNRLTAISPDLDLRLYDRLSI